MSEIDIRAAGLFANWGRVGLGSCHLGPAGELLRAILKRPRQIK